MIYASKHFFDSHNRHAFLQDFKWVNQFNWHNCTFANGNNLHDSSQNLRRLELGLVVYVENLGLDSITKESYLNMSGGQTKLKCTNHTTKFMMK